MFVELRLIFKNWLSAQLGGHGILSLDYSTHTFTNTHHSQLNCVKELWAHLVQKRNWNQNRNANRSEKRKTGRWKCLIWYGRERSFDSLHVLLRINDTQESIWYSSALGFLTTARARRFAWRTRTILTKVWQNGYVIQYLNDNVITRDNTIIRCYYYWGIHWI